MGLIVITGPTATGKSDVALELARRIDGEIVSADSMQIYTYMDIGTAKLKPEEMKGIKHYMIDELFPDEEFSIAVFQSLALKYINEIVEKSKTPILVGGTGFYINSVIYQTEFDEHNADKEYREQLYKLAREHGNKHIHNLLMETDPEAAGAIHFNNLKRLIRALEFYKLTGRRISEHNLYERRKEPRFDSSLFILNMGRDKLYERINRRVDIMIESGLEREVAGLLEMGYHEGLVSMQGIGYREMVMWLKGEMGYREAIDLIKRETRRYAKRQLTWFRGQTLGNWINIDEMGNKDIIVDEIEKHYRGVVNNEQKLPGLNT